MMMEDKHETRPAVEAAKEIADKIQVASSLLDEAEYLLVNSSDYPAALLDEVNAARIAAEYAEGEAETWRNSF